MRKYRINIISNVASSLKRNDLELKLVAGLFDLETELKTSDGENDSFEVVDYELTEATPIN